jgi:hypothetical protein
LIILRTALLKAGKAYVQAGGGWVNDSEPEAEFQKTVNQSKAFFPTALTRPSHCGTTLSRSRGRGTVALAETLANML